MGAFFQRQDVDQRYLKALEGIYRNHLDKRQRQPSALLTALALSFIADFLYPETKEPYVMKPLLRLKNLKDFLLSVINSRDQTMHLEDLSPPLANFNRRAFPDQYFTSLPDPLPHQTIFFLHLNSLVHSHYLT